MTLVWAVPVAAAAVATVLVAAAARPVGDELTALVDDVRELRQLREPLVRVRAATDASAAVAASFRRRHPPVTSPEAADDARGDRADQG